MSLNGALQVGRTALTASQVGLQVTGNNMANAATEGYSRQIAHLAPLQGQRSGSSASFVGRGVIVQDITRAVDTALQSRLRDAISQENGALIDQRFLTSIENIQNELSEDDLSTLLSDFFNGFSELANNPEDHAVRSVVIQEGVHLADRITAMRREYTILRDEVDNNLDAMVTAANDLLDQISQVNTQIVHAEQGVSTANSLRDQRDQLITKLSELIDISTIEQSNGTIDVFIASIPVVLAGQSRGVELRKQSVGNTLEVSVRVREDQSELNILDGRIGALLRQRDATVNPAIADLDEFTSQLIFQMNRLHSQGQGQIGFTDVTGTYGVADTTVPLNDTLAELPFSMENGSFFIHATHSDSNVRTTHQINFDPDTMSLQDLIDEINLVVVVPNITASTSVSNELTLKSDPGYEFSFSDDSSGVLAALGINTFFTGEDATDIGVNELIISQPAYLAVGEGHIEGSNRTALAIAGLQDVDITELGDRTLREYWQEKINAFAVRTNAANSAVDSTRLVRESILAQLQSVSGVSLDEEAINLLSYQRQFQAAARFISVIDELMDTLLSIA